MYDMKNLEKLKSLEANAPEAIKAFWAFDKAALAAGAISVKNKELIAIAVAFTTQCPYCIRSMRKGLENQVLPNRRSPSGDRLRGTSGWGRNYSRHSCSAITLFFPPFRG